MSDELKINLSKLGIVTAIAVSIVGLLGAWFILPYRMTAAEAKISAMEVQIAEQQTLLIRIDENVKQLKEASREK